MALPRKNCQNFYGPPGTGESQLARYIASRIDREIVSKSISDLMDPYVGGTEKNIRDVFLEAESKDALLIFDEVDGIIFDRERAQCSWEISHTNEFLLQMVRFRGVLICTTNRLTGKDKASIRRINHKIRFDFLEPEGGLIFYNKLLSSLTGKPINEKMIKALKSMKNQTPGDFKTVRDRMSFIPAKNITHQILIEALREEVEVKKTNDSNCGNWILIFENYN
ncbi:AAA family ATPase [bacterium]|nr:AAA family ATPase [bacterium]